MTERENPNILSALSQTGLRYLKLLAEDTRLNLAQKLTRILAATALFALTTIVVTVTLVFVSIAIAIALSEAIDPLWAFIIVAGFYVIVLTILIVGRRTLIVDPIARFISMVLLPEPEDNQSPAEHSEND